MLFYDGLILAGQMSGNPSGGFLRCIIVSFFFFYIVCQIIKLDCSDM